ncbi:MAG: hypothetical protein WEF50_17440 [Myxococcota bacterium]
MHPTRAIALSALLLVTLALPALAQTVQRPSDTLDTPNFLENWSQPPAAASADTSPPAEAERAAPTQAPDAETPSSSVDVEETGASEAKRSKTAPRNTLIEPYPQNPRCYVAGRYVPAPPLCPN